MVSDSTVFVFKKALYSFCCLDIHFIKPGIIQGSHDFPIWDCYLFFWAMCIDLIEKGIMKGSKFFVYSVSNYNLVPVSLFKCNI